MGEDRRRAPGEDRKEDRLRSPVDPDREFFVGVAKVLGSLAGTVVPGVLPVFALLDLAVVPGMKRRWQEWLEEINERLEEIEGRRTDFSIRDLAEDEAFLSLFAQASEAALRTHVDEKRQLLAGAVMQAATSPGSYDLRTAFLRFIDELSPLHVRLLRFVEANPELMADHDRVGSFKLFRRRFLESGASMGVSRAGFELAVVDLQNRALLRLSERMRPYGSVYRIPTPGPDDPLAPGETRGYFMGPMVQITDLAEQFLEFLSPSPQDHSDEVVADPERKQ